MRKIYFIGILVLSLLIINSCKKNSTGPDEPSVVTFVDANFEELIREVINKPTGEILNTDLLTITEIDGEDRNISIIRGIEYCKNLETLNLLLNNVIDISELSELIKLYELELGFNDITDIQVVTNLTNLERVYLAGNEIVDISSLSGLAKLSTVFLSYNLITDINPLVSNSGIGDGDFVSLVQNPLSDTSINNYIPQLEARGVTVNQ